MKTFINVDGVSTDLDTLINTKIVLPPLPRKLRKDEIFNHSTNKIERIKLKAYWEAM